MPMISLLKFFFFHSRHEECGNFSIGQAILLQPSLSRLVCSIILHDFPHALVCSEACKKYHEEFVFCVNLKFV